MAFRTRPQIASAQYYGLVRTSISFGVLEERISFLDKASILRVKLRYLSDIDVVTHLVYMFSSVSQWTY